MRTLDRGGFNTPILFIIFNRPNETRRVFEQIKKIKPFFLFIAADGPRQNRPEDQDFCRETRRIIEEIDWECEVKTLFRDVNLGCALAVSSGINWFFEQVTEGIILEDDCYPDLSFFYFCNELLTKYRDNNNIYLITGTNMLNGNYSGDNSYYFSNYPIVWGWASWRRAWNKYEYEMPDCEQAFKSNHLNHVFQTNREKKYWEKNILKIHNEIKKSTWDCQWIYSIWKNKGVTIVPNTNLIFNIGFTDNSTHTFLKDSLREPTIKKSIEFPLKHPDEQSINRVSDLRTFNNAFTHSPRRLLRLIRENGILKVFNYTLRRFKH